jgi:flagellar basal body rod protein FlgC
MARYGTSQWHAQRTYLQARWGKDTAKAASGIKVSKIQTEQKPLKRKYSGKHKMLDRLLEQNPDTI